MFTQDKNTFYYFIVKILRKKMFPFLRTTLSNHVILFPLLNITTRLPTRLPLLNISCYVCVFGKHSQRYSPLEFNTIYNFLFSKAEQQLLSLKYVLRGEIRTKRYHFFNIFFTFDRELILETLETFRTEMKGS